MYNLILWSLILIDLNWYNYSAYVIFIIVIWILLVDIVGIVQEIWYGWLIYGIPMNVRVIRVGTNYKYLTDLILIDRLQSLCCCYYILWFDKF